MFRLLPRQYDERYVIPTAHAEQAHALEELATDCPVSEYGGGSPEAFAKGPDDWQFVIENFRCCRRDRPLTAENRSSAVAQAGSGNLNWDGIGVPGHVPDRPKSGREVVPHRRDAGAERRAPPTPGSSSHCCSTTPMS